MTQSNLDHTTLFLDVRNHDEVVAHRFDDNYHISLNIPADMIKFNLEILRDIVRSKKYENIYVVCRSATRSGKVHAKYFANDTVLSEIKYSESLKFNGFKNPNQHITDLDLNIHTVHSNERPPISMIRIVQMLLGMILLLSGTFILYSCEKFKPLKYFMIAVGLFALYSGISGSCILSKILGGNNI